MSGRDECEHGSLRRACDLCALREELADMRRERDEARAVSHRAVMRLAEHARMREALGKLLDRIDFVSQHDEYRAVWMSAQLHRGPYRGPTYENAFNDARAALAEVTP